MSLQAAGAVRPVAPVKAMSPRHPLACARRFASPFSTKRLIILANSGDSGIILAIQGGPGAALGGYRLGLRPVRIRKRPPPWVERGGRRQAKEGLEGVAAFRSRRFSDPGAAGPGRP